ncbi:interferon kappa [Acomys russatus]|uniref:interferon kappa n=1 Tax=Acomys russatus TaxID=60746 RepID=UPI0021E21392|nr:interferon kappa [Acomys russatus]
MTPQCLWPVVLAALFISPIRSLSCVHLDGTTRENMKLLRSIVVSSPLQCLKEIKNFEFPKEIPSSFQHVKRDVKEVFYRVSVWALYIFSHNGSVDPVIKERLQRIRMGLYEQVRQAQDCFMEEDSKIQHPQPKGLWRVHLELNKYFVRIEKFLSDKKHSLCAWMVVGVEMRRCFMIFYKFKKLLKMQTGAHRQDLEIAGEVSP